MNRWINVCFLIVLFAWCVWKNSDSTSPGTQKRRAALSSGPESPFARQVVNKASSPGLVRRRHGPVSSARINLFAAVSLCIYNLSCESLSHNVWSGPLPIKLLSSRMRALYIWVSNIIGWHSNWKFHVSTCRSSRGTDVVRSPWLQGWLKAKHSIYRAHLQVSLLRAH